MTVFDALIGQPRTTFHSSCSEPSAPKSLKYDMPSSRFVPVYCPMRSLSSPPAPGPCTVWPTTRRGTRLTHLPKRSSVSK